jgi:hypothetical protein
MGIAPLNRWTRRAASIAALTAGASLLCGTSLLHSYANTAARPPGPAPAAAETPGDSAGWREGAAQRRGPGALVIVGREKASRLPACAEPAANVRLGAPTAEQPDPGQPGAVSLPVIRSRRDDEKVTRFPAPPTAASFDSSPKPTRPTRGTSRLPSVSHAIESATAAAIPPSIADADWKPDQQKVVERTLATAIPQRLPTTASLAKSAAPVSLPVAAEIVPAISANDAATVFDPVVSMLAAEASDPIDVVEIAEQTIVEPPQTPLNFALPGGGLDIKRLAPTRFAAYLPAGVDVPLPRLSSPGK